MPGIRLTLAITWPQRAQTSNSSNVEAAQVHGIIEWGQYALSELIRADSLTSIPQGLGIFLPLLPPQPGPGPCRWEWRKIDLAAGGTDERVMGQRRSIPLFPPLFSSPKVVSLRPNCAANTQNTVQQY